MMNNLNSNTNYICLIIFFQFVIDISLKGLTKYIVYISIKFIKMNKDMHILNIYNSDYLLLTIFKIYSIFKLLKYIFYINYITIIYLFSQVIDN